MVLQNQFMITRLPEKLILKIFSYLSHKELCRIVRVSKQWRRIAYDEHLWQSLNLRPEYGGLNVRDPLYFDLNFIFQINSVEDLINLINQRSGSSLKYIEMNSDLITVPALDELDNKCTNLKYMTLDFSNAMQLHDYNELMGFPNSLYYLCICLSDVIFMEGLMRKIYSCLNSLEVLHLIGTFEMGNEEEEEIYEVINISKIKAHTPNLRVINLYGIAFVEDSHVELLAMNCIHLECVALNYCINVKGACFSLLLANCNKIKTLLLRHCGLKDEFMIQVPWEKSKIHELDISSTELSQECLESILTRFKGFTYLSLSHVDFFNDKIMNRLIDEGKFENIEAIDLSFTPELTDEPINRFIDRYGPQMKGIMLHGKPHLAEYFWMMVIPKLKNIKLVDFIILLFFRICVLGTPHGWFFKYNTRVHVDRIIENFANNCPNLEALEIQWDPETIRFSDNSRKFIDHLRIRCWRLKSLTLEDGKYYEMVKGNFERASRHGVVRTTTIYNTTILILLKRFRDLQFN